MVMLSKDDNAVGLTLILDQGQYCFLVANCFRFTAGGRKPLQCYVCRRCGLSRAIHRVSSAHTYRGVRLPGDVRVRYYEATHHQPASVILHY